MRFCVISTNVAMSTPSNDTMKVSNPYGYGSNRRFCGAVAFQSAQATNAVKWQSTNQRLPANRLIASLTRADQLLAATALRSMSMIPAGIIGGPVSRAGGGGP